MTKSLKNVKNEKCTLKDLEYGEQTENHGKLEIHTLGREIWREKLKKVENLEMSTVEQIGGYPFQLITDLVIRGEYRCPDV